VLSKTRRSSRATTAPADDSNPKPKRSTRVRDIRASMPPLDADDTSEKLLLKYEVIGQIGLSYVSIWEMMQRGEFPRARTAGGRPVWLQSEIHTWIKQLPIRRIKGDR
jgi:predicted DNA-binding transcriptional regulator AlpA